VPLYGPARPPEFGLSRGLGFYHRIPKELLGRRQRRHPSLEAFAAVAGLMETKRAGTPFVSFGTRRRPATASSHRAASSSSEAHV
jgi:hypothetical protein